MNVEKRLALGTVQFGLRYGIANQHGQVGVDESRAIIACAQAAGLNTLDTAIVYGDSEQRLGEIGVEQWRVVSKLPAMPENIDNVALWVRLSVEASLRRLNVSHVYGLLLHSPSQLLGKQGATLYAALQQLKSFGVVEKIGISVYSPDELNALCANFDFDIVQAPFNILDHRLIDSGWLARLCERGVEVHARSVFLQGLLLMKLAARPAKFARWQPLWNHWQRWLNETGLTSLQACLRYALVQSGVERVIVGVDSLNQLKEILQASTGGLPELSEELCCNDPDLINPVNWGTF